MRLQSFSWWFVIWRWFVIWNRKFHIYLGLYFLLFLWLFAISGLLLNHPTWEFAQFWPQRQQSSFERPIQPLTAGTVMENARDLMQQLDMVGEIEQLTMRPERGQFEVQVVRPGFIRTLRADLATNRVKVEEIRTNGWGIVHMLHQFNGVRMDDSERGRDWFWTNLWAFSMDALAVGLIVMVLGGIYMWYQLRPKRLLGLIFLGLGVLTCGFFVVGLGFLP